MDEFLDAREKKILEVDTRRAIFGIVKKYAGCHFREIERKSKLATGTVKYHLHYLVKNGLITERKDGNVRYYPKLFKSKNKVLLGLLRQKSVRGILLFILTHKDCNHEQIVSAIGLSPSTVSWHLKKMVGATVVVAAKRGRKTFFSVVDSKEIMDLLITYQESFLDSLVDNVIEMWVE